MAVTNDLISTELTTRGVHNIYIPPANNILRIHNIDIFGGCWGVVTSEQLHIILEGKLNNYWKKIGGVFLSQNRDFERNYNIDYLELDVSNGIDPAIRANITGNVSNNEFKTIIVLKSTLYPS